MDESGTRDRAGPAESWDADVATRQYLGALFGAIGVAIVLPYAEELLRCFRVDGSVGARAVPKDTPDLTEHQRVYEIDLARRSALQET